jgi:hypothetical protein
MPHQWFVFTNIHVTHLTSYRSLFPQPLNTSRFREPAPCGGVANHLAAFAEGPTFILKPPYIDAHDWV